MTYASSTEELQFESPWNYSRISNSYSWTKIVLPITTILSFTHQEAIKTEDFKKYEK